MNLICYISPNDNGTAIIDKVTNTDLSLGGGTTSPVYTTTGPFDTEIKCLKFPISQYSSVGSKEYLDMGSSVVSNINRCKNFTMGFWLNTVGTWGRSSKENDMGAIFSAFNTEKNDLLYIYLNTTLMEYNRSKSNAGYLMKHYYDTTTKNRVGWKYYEIYFKLQSDNTYDCNASLDGVMKTNNIGKEFYPTGILYNEIHTNRMRIGRCPTTDDKYNGDSLNIPIYDFFIVDGILHQDNFEKPTTSILNKFIHNKIYLSKQEFYGLPK